MTKPVNIAGERYGKLIAVARVDSARWRFKCDCGNDTVAFHSNVRRGRTKSCGCGQGLFTHGLSRTQEYSIWEGMIARCRREKNGNYDRYGGRGIRVCERWSKFENFYADLGPRPSAKHSIERINNNGNYGPSNCKWATYREQRRNLRTNRIVEFRGKRMPLVDAADLAGMKYGTAAARLCRGWSVERALCWDESMRR